METRNIAYCPECHKTVKFIMRREGQLGTIKGEKYPYSAMVASCVHCGEELDVYNDENLKLLYDAYREAHNIIPLEKIREIPAMYGIGKRMLSLLLGWGEQTFTRYYNGYVPTKQYSDVLKEMYDNPSHYSAILEKGRNSINELTYRRSKLAIQKLLSVEPITIMKVAAYLRRAKDDLSSYRQQKLLYYTQGVSAAFCPKPLFSEPCEAWANGPVYREVFYKNKENAINDVLADLLSDEERAVVDNVLECFGRYDGDTLVDFTHMETPWIEARGDLPADAPSERIIPLESIVRYFSKVRDDYGMTSMMDMKRYAQDMFQRA
jgi:uncharacterized phage-associated protein